MLFPLRPVLNPDEVVIKEGGAALYSGTLYGRAGYNASLCVTNQRLILKPAYKEFAYPLSRITQVDEGQYGLFKAIRVEFDNGGQAAFGTSERPEWIDAIQKARTTAPDLPYTVLPTAPPSLKYQVGILIAIAILSVCGFLGSALLLGLIDWVQRLD